MAHYLAEMDHPAGHSAEPRAGERAPRILAALDAIIPHGPSERGPAAGAGTSPSGPRPDGGFAFSGLAPLAEALAGL